MKNDDSNDEWIYGPEQDMLALNRTPVAPVRPRTYAEKYKGWTKAGKRREKQILHEKRTLQNAHKSRPLPTQSHYGQEAPRYKIQAGLNLAFGENGRRALMAPNLSKDRTGNGVHSGDTGTRPNTASSVN